VTDLPSGAVILISPNMPQVFEVPTASTSSGSVPGLRPSPRRRRAES
jgi:hypothetical protein